MVSFLSTYSLLCLNKEWICTNIIREIKQQRKSLELDGNESFIYRWQMNKIKGIALLPDFKIYILNKPTVITCFTHVMKQTGLSYFHYTTTWSSF